MISLVESTYAWLLQAEDIGTLISPKQSFWLRCR